MPSEFGAEKFVFGHLDQVLFESKSKMAACEIVAAAAFAAGRKVGLEEAVKTRPLHFNFFDQWNCCKGVLLDKEDAIRKLMDDDSI